MAIKKCAYCGREINTMCEAYYICKEPLLAEVFIEDTGVSNAFCTASCALEKFKIKKIKDQKPYYYCRPKCDGNCNKCEFRPLLHLCNDLNIQIEDMVNILCHNITSKHELFADIPFPKEFFVSIEMQKYILTCIQENMSLEDIISSDKYISYYLSNLGDAQKVSIFYYKNYYITNGYVLYRIDNYFAKILKNNGINEETPNEAIAGIRDTFFRSTLGTIRLNQIENSISVVDALQKDVLIFTSNSIVGKAETPTFHTQGTEYLQFIKIRVSLIGSKKDPSLVKDYLEEIKDVAIKKIENHRSFKKYGLPIGVFAITNMTLLSTWQVEITFEVKKDLLDK